jgi:hypothetical protein
MSSGVPWSFANISADRQSNLAEPFEFSALITQTTREIHNARCKKDKGSHEAKGSWRPIVWFDIDRSTFDRFFNSPYGYRGQFLRSAQAGQEANGLLVAALADALGTSSKLTVPLDSQSYDSLASRPENSGVSHSSLRINLGGGRKKSS